MIEGIIIDLSNGNSPESARFLSNEAVYENYKFNRLAHPEVPVSYYEAVFPNVEALEARYKAERN